MYWFGWLEKTRQGLLEKVRKGSVVQWLHELNYYKVVALLGCDEYFNSIHYVIGNQYSAINSTNCFSDHVPVI